jgi:hypothetical protein
MWEMMGPSFSHWLFTVALICEGVPWPPAPCIAQGSLWFEESDIPGPYTRKFIFGGSRW